MMMVIFEMMIGWIRNVPLNSSKSVFDCDLMP